MIMEYAMKDETRAKVLGTYQYKTKATEQHPEGIPLTSTMYSRIYGNEAPGVLVKVVRQDLPMKQEAAL